MFFCFKAKKNENTPNPFFQANRLLKFCTSKCRTCVQFVIMQAKIEDTNVKGTDSEWSIRWLEQTLLMQGCQIGFLNQKENYLNSNYNGRFPDYRYHTACISTQMSLTTSIP